MDNPTEAQKGFGGTSMWMVYSAFLSGLSLLFVPPAEGGGMEIFMEQRRRLR